jgi:hypothetical protein
MLCNPKILCSLHKRTSFVSVLSGINLFHPLLSCFPKPNLILSSHLCQGPPKCPVSSVISTGTLYAYLFSSMYVTCPTNGILLDLTTWIVSGAGINHKAPHYAVFFSPWLLTSSYLVSSHISCTHKTTAK